MSAWFSAFLFTQIVEIPIYVVALRDRALPAALAIAFGASLITHPILWWVFPHLALPWLTAVVLLELAVALVEAAYLYAWRTPRALRWSLLANAAGVALGLLLRALVGWP